MKLIKKAVEIGNGAAVYVPREYKNREVIVILPEGVEDIRKRILSRLIEFMPNILGVYLYGSYARNEARQDSDIDVLVITDNINNKIKEENYEIIFISKEAVEKQLKENILPLLPMLKEAKTLINPQLIEEFKNVELTKENLKFHIETTKSALKVLEQAINLCRKNYPDSIAYSLILRLREIYIINCLIKNKQWSNKEFVSLIEKITGSKKSYEGYIRAKNNESNRAELETNDAFKIYNHIKRGLEKQIKWAEKRK